MNFSGGSERFSNYVLEELTAAIVNQRVLTAVDRQQLELVRSELSFQMSGEVSDESAQEIGRMLGAQSIVSGSLENIGNVYRFRIRAIEVASASIQAAFSANIRNDQMVQSLMGVSGDAVVSAEAASTPIIIPQPVPSDTYQDFTTGRRIGAGFLNWFFGVGSFTMGNWVNGLIIGGTELLGVILMNVGPTETYNSGSSGYNYTRSLWDFGGIDTPPPLPVKFPYEYTTGKHRPGNPHVLPAGF
ncbi:MAG: penicillin-binding protein activator LpoB, partial [Treponema sp.]|nr:penicillin-binding protein activator LpoB [Treponema sp.]